MTKRRYRAVVEGCVDAALASNIMKKVIGSNGSVDTDIQGGWRNVVRMSVTYLTSGADVGIVAFVDADYSVTDRVKEVETMISSILQTGVRVYGVNEEGKCFLVNLGSWGRLGLVIWSDSNGGGTVEDVLRNALAEKHGCEFNANNIESCRDCPSGYNLHRRYTKLEVLCVLAACAGGGTLALSEESKYCGLNLNRIIMRLGLLNADALKEYVECVRKIIPML